jgi:hypothetical protein
MNEWGPGMPVHFFWIVGLFALTLIGVAVAFAIVWAVRAASHPAFPPGTPPTRIGTPPPGPQAPPQVQRETPLEILQRRFASGEITAEEYQRARDLLGGGKG